MMELSRTFRLSALCLLICIIILTIYYSHADGLSSVVRQLHILPAGQIHKTTPGKTAPDREYIPSRALANPPQLDLKDGYSDQLHRLDQIDLEMRNTTDLSDLRYSIVIPTYVHHFDRLITFLTSMKCLCNDYDSVDINIILSDTTEVEHFRDRLQEVSAPCPSRIGIFDVPPRDPERPVPQVRLWNLYDILPSRLQAEASPNDTSPLLRKYSKFKYQGIKKMCAALVLDYDFGLWLDSEALVVQPFSIRGVFDAFVKEPVFWRSRIATAKLRKEVMTDVAAVLGRSVDSFGTRYWNMESGMWMYEKAIIEDLYEWVGQAHGREFWSVWLESPYLTFEFCLYMMHIEARKLETTDSIFSKYKILETERELVRFGLAPAVKHRVHYTVGGFYEHIYLLLKEPGMQPRLSAFMNRYHVSLQRVDDFDFADAEIIKRWLLESPIYMLVCGAPDLHSWWS